MRATRSSSDNFSGGSWTDREQNSVTVPDHESPGPNGAGTSLEGVLRRIDADLTRARVPFALIAARGFHRGRNLIADLNGLLRR